MSRIRDSASLTQSQLAELAGTSQPAIAAYESGSKIPSVRTLTRLANVVGLELDISVTKSLTREERRSIYLHRAIARKLVEDPGPVIERARSNIRVMRDLHPGAIDLLRDWEVLLDGSVELLVDIMTNKHLHARELRQVTPFAGVLTASDRTAVYTQFRLGGCV